MCSASTNKKCNYCEGPLGSKLLRRNRKVVWDDVRACSARCEFALECLLDGCSLDDTKRAWEAGVRNPDEFESWQDKEFETGVGASLGRRDHD